MRSSVPDGPALAGWQRVGRYGVAEQEFIFGGKHGLRAYTPRRPRVRRDVVAEWLASERTPREIVRGDGDMSGIYQDQNESAPGGGAETRAQVAAGLAQAYQATAADQQSAHDFFVATGATVVGGHPDVRHPGAQGDPDPQLDSADS
jgi:hypothetical protein